MEPSPVSGGADYSIPSDKLSGSYSGIHFILSVRENYSQYKSNRTN